MPKTTEANTPTPGQYVREKALKPKKISITDAAKLLGVGRPTLSNFLNGKADVSTDMAARVERTFGIPAQKLFDLQAAYDAAEAKAKGAPAETRSYVPPFLAIKASEIESWASGIPARIRLSVFLRTLVNSTGIGLTGVDFPGNDDAERKGWDGYAIAAQGTPWVPEGRSGWEFGTNKDPKAKGDGDYINRLKSTSKEERAETTFVFVTPRRWDGKRKWEEGRRKEGRWKDVRAFDASDLEQWTEQSIAGQTWFANEIMRPSYGVHSLDKEWSDWASGSQTPLAGKLFDAAVEANKKIVLQRLSQEPQDPTIIAADSTGEALAFLSQLFGGAVPELYAFRDRVVVFHTPGILPKLAAGATNFIAVMATREAERELGPFVRSLHSFVIYPRNAPNVEPHIVLEPLNEETFRLSLEAMGASRDEIVQLGDASGRSLTVLRRRLSTVPAVRTPEWAEGPSIAPRLVPFLFAGAWNDANKNDQTILSFLAADTPYPALEKTLQELTGLDDAPVWSVGSYRGVVSKLDLLFAIANTITPTELNTYFDVARLVLSEDDPSLTLPEEDRWKAGIFGKTREISPALRSGISETLVLLAVHGNALFEARLGLNPEAMAGTLVRELLTPLTTHALEAHERDLPTYAEAGPEEFLSILQADLRADEPASVGLMRPATSGIFGNCPRTGLLWALEGLAWAPGTFARAALVLARLAEVKIDDNWANKPIESLNSIFRAWMPQTAANLDQRIKVTQLLAQHHPSVAWDVCVDQFDSRQTVAHYNHKPRWRNDANGFGEPLINAEAYAFRSGMIEMALGWKHHNKDTLSDLIERIYDLNEQQQASVWKLVEQWASAGASENDKAWVREKIRTTVMSRRSTFRNQKLKTDGLIEAADTAYDALEPTDLLNKHEWLFRQDYVDESADEIEEMDMSKRQARITALRTNALKDIHGKHGIGGILEFAEMGKTPGLIGFITASILPAADVADFLLTALPPGAESWTRRNIVYGALHSLKDNQIRLDVLARLKEKLSDSEFISILQLAPFDSVTWGVVQELDASLQSAYWEKVSLPQWPPEAVEDLATGVEKLIDAKRPRAAFNLVHFSLKKLPPTLLFRLMNEVASERSEPSGTYQLDSYYIAEAFTLLDASNEFSTEQMAGLEFPYIDALTRQIGVHGAHGIPNLDRYVEGHPELFIDAVTWLYKRRDGKEDPQEPELDELMRSNRAQRGLSLLESLEGIPGRDSTGEIKAPDLAVWINTVRQACAERGRPETGDISIGKLLSNAPPGKDGVWPAEPVRQVLEDIQAPDVSRGIVTGLYNSRGAHWRGEGGAQERELALKYREWAEALEFSHPFVATTVLMHMAETYEREAKGHDTEARIQRRLRV